MNVPGYTEVPRGEEGTSRQVPYLKERAHIRLLVEAPQGASPRYKPTV